MKNLIILLFIVVTFFSCNPMEIPPPVDNKTPEFSFVGNIGGTNFSFDATTGYTLGANYLKDSSGLYTLTGSFLYDSCLACPSILSFDINANTLVNNQAVYNGDLLIADSAISNVKVFNSYSIDNTLQNIYDWQYDISPSGAFLGSGNFSYNLVDTVISNSGVPFQYFFKTPGIKKISVITNVQGVQDTLYRKIRVGYGASHDTITINNIDTLQNVNFSAPTDSNTAIFWNFGDGTIQAGATVAHTFSNNTKYRITNYKVYGSDTFTKDITIDFSNQNVPIISPQFILSANYVSVGQALSPRQNLSSCIITHNINGKTYKSFKNNKNINQSLKPIFIIKKSMPFINNPAGQKTVKLIGSVNTYLYNVNNAADSIYIKCDKVSIAVAVPN
jgi:PKD domain